MEKKKKINLQKSIDANTHIPQIILRPKTNSLEMNNETSRVYTRDFLLPPSQERHPIRGGGYEERVEVTGKRRERKTDSLAPFAPFCATHPLREQEKRSLVFGFLTLENAAGLCRSVSFRATCFHLGDIVGLAKE